MKKNLEVKACKVLRAPKVAEVEELCNQINMGDKVKNRAVLLYQEMCMKT